MKSDASSSTATETVQVVLEGWMGHIGRALMGYAHLYHVLAPRALLQLVPGLAAANQKQSRSATNPVIPLNEAHVRAFAPLCYSAICQGNASDWGAPVGVTSKLVFGDGARHQPTGAIEFSLSGNFKTAIITSTGQSPDLIPSPYVGCKWDGSACSVFEHLAKKESPSGKGGGSNSVMEALRLAGYRGDELGAAPPDIALLKRHFDNGAQAVKNVGVLTSFDRVLLHGFIYPLRNYDAGLAVASGFEVVPSRSANADTGAGTRHAEQQRERADREAMKQRAADEAHGLLERHEFHTVLLRDRFVGLMQLELERLIEEFGRKVLASVCVDDVWDSLTAEGRQRSTSRVCVYGARRIKGTLEDKEPSAPPAITPFTILGAAAIEFYCKEEPEFAVALRPGGDLEYKPAMSTDTDSEPTDSPPTTRQFKPGLAEARAQATEDGVRDYEDVARAVIVDLPPEQIESAKLILDALTEKAVRPLRRGAEALKRALFDAAQNKGLTLDRQQFDSLLARIHGSLAEVRDRAARGRQS